MLLLALENMGSPRLEGRSGPIRLVFPVRPEPPADLPQVVPGPSRCWRLVRPFSARTTSPVHRGPFGSPPLVIEQKGRRSRNATGRKVGTEAMMAAKSLKNGGSDGTRTRDLRRDRPTL